MSRSSRVVDYPMYTDVRNSDNSSHPRILQAKKDKPEPAPVVAKVGYSHPSGVSVAREKAPDGGAASLVHRGSADSSPVSPLRSREQSKLPLFMLTAVYKSHFRNDVG